MRQPERRFINQFVEVVSKRYRTAFFYKIADGYRTGNKPFDCILDNGRVFYLEFKYLPKNRKSFSVRSVFKPHQVRILTKLHELYRDQKYSPAWGVLKNKGIVYLIPATQLQQQQILLQDLQTFSLEEVVDFFCKN